MKQHTKATKKHYVYALDNSLQDIDYNIEHAIIKVCEKEIHSVRTVEVHKQQLMSKEDYSMMEIFRHID